MAPAPPSSYRSTHFTTSMRRARSWTASSRLNTPRPWQQSTIFRSKKILRSSMYQSRRKQTFKSSSKCIMTPFLLSMVVVWANWIPTVVRAVAPKAPLGVLLKFRQSLTNFLKSQFRTCRSPKLRACHHSRCSETITGAHFLATASSWSAISYKKNYRWLSSPTRQVSKLV